MMRPGSQHSGYDVFHLVRELCLEREPIIKMPSDTPVYVAELFATLGATIESDPSLPPFRTFPTTRRVC